MGSSIFSHHACMFGRFETRPVKRSCTKMRPINCDCCVSTGETVERLVIWQVIIKEGDQGHEFFVIKEGEAEVLIMQKKQARVFMEVLCKFMRFPWQ